jgi:hypothetical protein
MRRRKALVLTLAAVGLQTSIASQPLANPFARPGSSSAGEAAAAVPIDLQLRATLVRGRASSANIGGTIVRVGERVGGYRLVSVYEGAAVLVDATGVTHVLEIEPAHIAP